MIATIVVLGFLALGVWVAFQVNGLRRAREEERD